MRTPGPDASSPAYKRRLAAAEQVLRGGRWTPEDAESLYHLLQAGVAPYPLSQRNPVQQFAPTLTGTELCAECWQPLMLHRQHPPGPNGQIYRCPGGDAYFRIQLANVKAPTP